MPAKARIKLPEKAALGEIVEVKALINHVMETGNRRDASGQSIPRDIINTFIATYAGREVFRATFGPGISANPFIAFYVRITEPGAFELTWIDDHGERTVERASLSVA